MLFLSNLRLNIWKTVFDEVLRLKHIKNRRISAVQTKTILGEEDNRDFMGVFLDLKRDLTEANKHTDIPEVYSRYAKLLQYNIPVGQKTSGLALVAAYKTLEKPELLTPENIRLANILGWCVEMMLGCFLVLDDVMDGSETRQGVPCWHKNKNVGLGAINDGLLLEASLYSIVTKYFSQHRNYSPILEHFHVTILKSTLGQSLDHSTSLECDLHLFTTNRYNAVVKYKTSYSIFHTPVTLAMLLANILDPELHQQKKSILLKMGYLYQVQNDFLDCFGDPKVTGKVGNDIQEGKCTWLAVTALQKATPVQRKILEDCYGKSDPVAVEMVKKVYQELNLPNTFVAHEEEMYNLLCAHIQQISKSLPNVIFTKILNKIYRRDK